MRNCELCLSVHIGPIDLHRSFVACQDSPASCLIHKSHHSVLPWLVCCEYELPNPVLGAVKVSQGINRRKLL